MMRRPRLTYANVVSTICLFLLLGGSAWAASGGLGKNSVGTRQLKNGAVTGAKVKDGSLSGADIKAATLGTVPKAKSAGTATSASHATDADSAGHADNATDARHATSADRATRAGDATTLDGVPATGFVAPGRVPRLDFEGDWSTEFIPNRTILTAGPLTLSTTCEESGEAGGHTLFQLLATGASGSTLDYSLVLETELKDGVFSLDPTGTTLVARLTSESTPLRAFFTLVYRDSARTISIPLAIYVGSPDDVCRVLGSGIVAE